MDVDCPAIQSATCQLVEDSRGVWPGSRGLLPGRHPLKKFLGSGARQHTPPYNSPTAPRLSQVQLLFPTTATGGTNLLPIPNPKLHATLPLPVFLPPPCPLAFCPARSSVYPSTPPRLVGIPHNLTMPAAGTNGNGANGASSLAPNTGLSANDNIRRFAAPSRQIGRASCRERVF